MKADLLLHGVHVATLDTDEGYGELHDAAIAIADGRIAWLGPARERPAQLQAQQVLDLGGGWLTPGLIDCHTHLVWAGSRAAEIERRWQGASYEEIARAGGGIVSTVAATRAASEAQLLEAAAPRLLALRGEGVTTVEIKSGYGLEVAAELRLLRVARELGRRHGVQVRTTFLGAHALPPEYRGQADAYVDEVCHRMLPAVHAEGLADAVDAYCEGIGFSPAQTRRVFEAAQALGLPVKLHADQLSDLGGAALAAEYHALSADHIEYSSPASIEAMARAGTVAVLLPGAYYCLREQRRPPVDALRARRVPMAVSTDCNPGTSPCTSLLLMLHMACTLFGLTPAEALAGVTRHAAQALGLQQRTGRLRVGLDADLAWWAIDHPRDLVCQFGFNPLRASWRQGQLLVRHPN
ncbi:imidazolonepropionase [Caldimonas brevitalea]|uniref:Imidazolonepropionase n=1 Tax=Caldimonas brevitalea TaxID=413882 RepID=A8KCI5_9BURK|nr:imidazolonepropionase [Caldimonas brevitalea]AKJ29084.1 imidazolonepropionase [Caldimonas brevitalea]CAL80817.1 imidazolonepropionase [Caldimonas brevitalea]